MSSDTSNSDIIDDLIDEFVSRQHAGESPSITEYCEKYPDLSEDLRDLLPMVSMMEGAKSESADFAPASASLPDQIGPYRIIREIGRGGMGVVYEAQHTQLGRTVAVKVLAKRLATSKRALARFQREARAVAKLHHTNIVPLFEVGEDDGESYLTMQLIKGTSLDQVIDQIRFDSSGSRGTKPGTSRARASTSDSRSGLPSQNTVNARASTWSSAHSALNRLQPSSTDSDSWSRSVGTKRFRPIVRIAQQVAEALHYAHGRGVIHRDVKPSNILLDEHGVVWLTDFGLAKSDQEEETNDLTQTGDFLGTMRYMAPERFRGECDERADVYSLGLTLYEMLTGKEVFETSDRLKLMRMIDESEPRSPRSFDLRIPRDLETIVLKAISKDPESRYKSAGAVADDLGRFIQDRPIKARRHTVTERLIRWSRRNKSLAASLAGIATLLVAMVAGLLIANVRESGLRQQSEAAKQMALQRGDELEQNLYFSHMTLAGQAASQTVSSKSIGPRLNQWAPQEIGRELRGWEWYYLRALTEQMAYSSPRLFKGGFRWCWSVDYSPGGDEIVNTINGWGIQVRSSTGDVLREKFLGSARFVQWSPDGTRIAVAGFGDPANVRICDARSLDVVAEIECADHGEIECAKWSPDSSRIVVGGDGKFAKTPLYVRAYDAVTGEEQQSIETSARAICVDYSPDGTRIASGHADYSIRVWSTATGEMLAELDAGDYPYDVRWNSDGTKLAIAMTVPQCWHVDAKHEQQPVVVKGENIAGKSIAWHPHTDQLAVGGINGVIQLLDGDTLKTTRTLVGNMDQIWSLAWQRDGTQLATANLYEGRIEIWNVGPDNQNFVRHPQIGYTAVAWTPDGNSLVSPHDIWNLSTGGHIKFEVDDSFTCLAVNPSDGRIALGGQRTDVIVRRSDGQETQSMPGDVSFTRALGWSRDGQLAALSMQGWLNVWDNNGKRTVERKQIHQGAGIHLRWSPDCRTLATTAGDNFVRIWDTSNWDLFWEAQDEDHPVYEACWNDDGSRLVTSHDGLLKIWNSSTGEHLETLDEVQENFRSLDWSPDGSRLAVGSRSSLTIWDVQQKRVALRLALGGGVARWNPDGQRLAISVSAKSLDQLARIRILDARQGYQVETEER